MELLTYLDILRRRIWIIILIVGIVVIYAGYQYYVGHKANTTSTNYHNSITVRIALQEGSGSQTQHFADYTAVNDTLADEFNTSPIITSPAFSALIAQQIQYDMPLIDQQYKTPPNLGDWQNTRAISSSLASSRTHSLVTFIVSWNTDAGARAIAQATGEVIVAHISEFSDYEIRTTPDANQPLAAAQIISPATAQSTAVSNTNTPTSKTTTLLLLIIVGLIIAIALAFLIEYLDDRIRRPEEVVQLLGLPVYAEIPRAPAAGQPNGPASKG